MATPSAQGNVKGVIGPEAANDAVEGGALASTLAFGIPGSSSMAILLSGLFILGLDTGPQMLNQNVDIVFVMIFTIIIGNLIGTIVGMFLVNPLSRATSIRASVMVPVLMAIIATGAFAGERAIFDIGVAVVFGIIGYVMKILNYSRAALLIGFVLGFAVEKNLYLALLLDGPLFILQPIPAGLALVTVVFLAWNVWTVVRDQKEEVSPCQANLRRKMSPASRRNRHERRGNLFVLEICFLGLIGVICVLAFFEALTYKLVSSRTPFVIMAPLLILIAIHARRLWGARGEFDISARLSAARSGLTPGFNKVCGISAWMVAMVLMIIVLGHYAGIFLFCVILMRFLAKEAWIADAGDCRPGDIVRVRGVRVHLQHRPLPRPDHSLFPRIPGLLAALRGTAGGGLPALARVDPARRSGRAVPREGRRCPRSRLPAIRPPCEPAPRRPRPARARVPRCPGRGRPAVGRSRRWPRCGRGGVRRFLGATRR